MCIPVTGLTPGKLLEHSLAMRRTVTGATVGNLTVIFSMTGNAIQTRMFAGAGFVNRRNRPMTVGAYCIVNLCAILNSAR